MLVSSFLAIESTEILFLSNPPVSLPIMASPCNFAAEFLGSFIAWDIPLSISIFPFLRSSNAFNPASKSFCASGGSSLPVAKSIFSKSFCILLKLKG